jgi:hypothetical protein
MGMLNHRFAEVKLNRSLASLEATCYPVFYDTPLELVAWLYYRFCDSRVARSPFMRTDPKAQTRREVHPPGRRSNPTPNLSRGRRKVQNSEI